MPAQSIRVQLRLATLAAALLLLFFGGLEEATALIAVFLASDLGDGPFARLPRGIGILVDEALEAIT